MGKHDLSAIHMATQLTSNGNRPSPTYTQGNKRIDYMVGTKRVVQNMLQSGIKACSGLFGGDHRSLLIDVYLLAAQLKGKINDLHNDQNQGLNGKDPSIFKPYKQMYSNTCMSIKFQKEPPN